METRKLAKVMSDFSMLPAFIINMKEKTVDIVSTGSVREDVFSVITKELIIRIATEHQELKAFRYVHSTALSLLFFNLSDDVLVFGPFYIRVRESELLISELEKKYDTMFSSHKKSAIVDSIRVKDNFFSDAWKDTLCMILGLEDFNLKEIREPSSEDSDESTKISEIAASRMIQSEVSFGYGFEKKIRQAIIAGDKEKLFELLLPKHDIATYASEVGSNIKYRFEGNSLGSRKNAQIILNTIFRLSAENAGLPPIYLHSISDGISRAINQVSNEEEGFKVLEKMINSYCDAINRLGIGNRSYRITRTQKYILSNLPGELSLDTLAEIADTSPQHLSRLFRKECGMTITQYIRLQKINEAKWLISTSDTPMVEIAESLGFSSQNYFCNVFKEETGMTPSQYKAKSELTRNP